MITKRRQWMAVLVFTAAALLAGCASKVEGTGSFAAGSADGPTGQSPTGQLPTGQLPTGQLPTTLPTTLPTGLPTDTGGQPTTAPPTQPTQPTQPTAGSPTGEQSNGEQLCAAASAAQLEKIFGGKVEVKATNSSSCEFTGPNDSALLAVFKDYGDGLFTVTGQKKQAKGGKDLTIAGHPACLTNDKALVVSRTSSPSTGGIVKAYGMYEQSDEKIATQLMEIVVPKFVM